MHVYIHGRAALVLPCLSLLLSNVSVVLRVQLARPVKHSVSISTRLRLRAVLIGVDIPTVTLRPYRTPDLTRARRLLVFVPVAVVARTAVVPNNDR
jgi:hypothetical protein